MANAQVNSYFVPNNRGGRFLVFNSNKFSIKTRRNDTIHWRCCVSTCRATVNTKNDLVTTFNNQHNHETDYPKIIADTVMTELKAKVKKCSRPISSLYQEELANLRAENIDNDILSKLPTFYSTKTSLYKARAKTRPTLPKSRSDISLPEVYTKTLTGQDFLLADDGDVNRILIFATDENIVHLSRAPVIFCDGTFDKSPKIFHQIYSVHTFVDGQMRPMIYGLLPNKKQNTYENFFTLISYKARALGNPSHQHIFFTDFETAAQNAARKIFPWVIMKGCFFHYSQAVYKYAANTCKLQTEYAENEEVKRLVRRAIALPFVPVANISYWVEGSHGLGTWNHFETVGPRTTNHVEGWHRKLQLLISSSQPNIFTLIDFFKKEQAYQEVSMLQVESGGKARPRRRRYRIVDEKLQRYKNRYTANELSVLEYLDRVANCVGY